MKFNSLKYNLSLLVIILISSLALNCSDDSKSSDDTQTELTVENFTISINELPITQGDFLGTIESNMEVNFNVISQNPQGALTIDDVTGDIIIANPTVFDFEINPVIQATVEAITSEDSSEATITININNLDEIEFYLTDSKQSYIDAEINDWIHITENEYNTLATNLKDVSKLGTTDTQYDSDIQTEPAINQNLTIVNNNSSIIPQGSYVFAFKYYAFVNVLGGAIPPIEDAKVRMTETDIANGYYDLGNNLPSHETGNRYFVLKGNSTLTNATGYLGVCESDGMGYKRILGTNVYSGPCNFGDFFNEENNEAAGGLVVMYQGLSTTLKQWD